MNTQIVALYDSYEQRLQESYVNNGGSVKYVGPYDAFSNNQIKSPGIFFDIEELVEGPPTGDDRIVLVASCALHCVIGLGDVTSEKAQILARSLAADLIAFLRFTPVVLPNITAGLPSDIDARPGDFKLGQDGYESWVVEFDQKLYIQLAEDEQLTPIDTVCLGRAPEIGEDHVDDYVQIVPDPE